MDVYKFAMQMEKDGEDFYRQLGREATFPGLAVIFTMLADEEVKHYQVVERLRRKDEEPQTAESAILDQVKNVFIGMRKRKEKVSFDNSAVASYRQACTIEEESERFYREQAGLAEDEHQRWILSRLAGEEAKHLRVMENILEFVSRPEPGNWLENAEWHHLDEY